MKLSDFDTATSVLDDFNVRKKQIEYLAGLGINGFSLTIGGYGATPQQYTTILPALVKMVSDELNELADKLRALGVDPDA